MGEIDLSRVRPSDRAAVERRLATRYRLDDGSRPSETLREMFSRGRFSGKAVRGDGHGRLYGLLLDWPGCDEPTFLPTLRALWEALDLPIQG